MPRSLRLLAPLLLSTLIARADLSFEKSGNSLQILENGKPLLSYRTDSRVPYLDPLPSPSGACLTRHWPMRDKAPEEERDHPHHRAFWLSHGEVNGFDFWAWKGKGDPKIEHRAFSATQATQDSVAFTVDLAWTADGATQLLEKRQYTFRRTDEKTYEITLESTLTAADRDVEFGDTKEGFVGIRVDRTLRLKGPQAKGRIDDSEGRSNDDCWGKRSNWVAFSGPDETGTPAVIALMDHPKNLRHPTWWHARDYGLLAANPFGIHDFEKKSDKTLGLHSLKKGQSLTFRYLVVLHQGTVADAKLPERFQAFSR